MTCATSNPCAFSWIAALALVLFVTLDRAVAAFWTKKWNPATWRKAVVGLAAVGAIWILIKRDAWLPFLGEAAIPPTAFLVSSPDYADTTATVTAPSGATRVVYWAAENQANSLADSPEAAYGAYGNAGVAQVVDGKAALRFRKPGSYRVRFKTLAPHVHYRFLFPSGIASDVRTLFLNS